MNDIYTSGTYLQNNPNWHEEDSLWKAVQIKKMIDRHKLQPQSVIEVGCGTGLVITQLQKQMREGIDFNGYDISPQAIDRAKTRENLHLHFFNRDILETQATCDLMLFIDLIEHIEDYWTFLRRTKLMSTYKIFHIPLDLSVQSVLRIHTILDRRKSVGHIHYFTKELALQALKDLDFEIIDSFFTAVTLDLPSKSLTSTLAKIPRRFLFSMNQDLAARTLGGFSLMVLAK